MNFNWFLALKGKPLCFINALAVPYTDTLNLTTGVITRYIQQYTFDGTEDWAKESSPTNTYSISMSIDIVTAAHKSSHFACVGTLQSLTNGTFAVINDKLLLKYNATTSLTDFKRWLANQYTNGTPVKMYIVNSTPTTEIITVPTGLTGTVNGTLSQSGTPTPTNPIYPTANTVEKWFDINHYIHNTSTDTITTPVDIYANDTTATVGLKGQTQQNGTPTPDNPIQPSECGEMSINIVPPIEKWVNGYPDGSDGGIAQPTSNKEKVSAYVKIETNTSYVFSVPNGFPTSPWRAIAWYRSDGRFIRRDSGYSSDPLIAISPDTAYYARFSFRTNGQSINAMVNEGETVLPYEPYGQYKIPILSNGVTINVYLGEVQSARRVKKLVLTGNENWENYDTTYSRFELKNYLPFSIRTRETPMLCTHYIGIYDGRTVDEVPNNAIYSGPPTIKNIYIKTDEYTTTAAFKTFLTNQYANGTPVTIYTILAETETAIVNEPIRKIGDYADTVSGVSIPTVEGANVVDVLTTLKPSEVNVNYHGWHPVQSVHEYDSNYTIATMQALTIAQLQTHTISELQGGEWS